MPLNLLRGYGRPLGPARRVVREATGKGGNDCNLPSGASDGGQFGRKDDPRCGSEGAAEIPSHWPDKPWRAITTPVNKFEYELGIKQEQVSSNEVWEYLDTPKGKATFAMKNQYTANDDHVELHWLIATKRGAGRAAMERVVALADKHGVTLGLWALPLPGQGENEGFRLSVPRLEAFYRGFGFRRTKREDGVSWMERKPAKARRTREGNDCNLPSGESDGGQFGRNDDPRCVGGPGGSDRIVLSRSGNFVGQGRPSTSQIEDARIEREQLARITALPRGDLRDSFFRALAAQSLRQGVERLAPKDFDALMQSYEHIARMRDVRAEVETPPRQIPPPAPEPTTSTELTSQDTKKSSTKQTSYEADDNITGRPVGRKGDSIFGEGVTNTTIAHELTKYITEDMTVSIRGDVEGLGEATKPGPDPDAAETRALYDKAMADKSAAMATQHEVSAQDAFDNYAHAVYREVGAVVRGVLIDNIKFHLENPELTPQEADPRQMSFDLDEDPSTTDFERQRHLLTPEKVIEILDAHELLTRQPGSPNWDGTNDSGIASRIEAELANGNFSEQFDSQDVLSTLFDASHEDYDDPNVVAAREAIRALRPTDEAFEDKGREVSSDYMDMVDEGVRTAFKDTDYFHNFVTQDEPRNSLRERWYKDTDQAANAPWNNTTFNSWYTSQYGHSSYDWAQVTAAAKAGAGSTGPKDGEQRFEFHGEDGSAVTRVFSREGGNLRVYHSYFTNHGPAGQGKGLMRGQMELYEKLGVTEMTTTANISTGSYAWARYGFLADSPESLAYEVRNRLDSMLSQAPALRGLRERIGDVIDSRESDSDLPWHVADMRITGTPAEMREIANRFKSSRQNYATFDSKEAQRWDADLMRDADNGSFNIGKVLMVGHNWGATFDMRDETQRARMRDYIGDWTKPADGSGPLTPTATAPEAPAAPAAPRGRPVLRPRDAPLGTRVERMTNTGRVTATISDTHNDGDPYFRYDRDDQKTIDKVDSGWADGEWRKKVSAPAPAATAAKSPAIVGRTVKRPTEVPVGTRVGRMSDRGLITATVTQQPSGVFYRYDPKFARSTTHQYTEPYWRVITTPKKA